MPREGSNRNTKRACRNARPNVYLEPKWLRYFFLLAPPPALPTLRKRAFTLQPSTVQSSFLLLLAFGLRIASTSGEQAPDCFRLRAPGSFFFLLLAPGFAKRPNITRKDFFPKGFRLDLGSFLFLAPPSARTSTGRISSLRASDLIWGVFSF